MSRSSLRSIRKRAQRKTRYGAYARAFDRACAKFTNGISAAMFDGVAVAGRQIFGPVRAALVSAVADAIVGRVVRLGAIANRLNQQHGDADGAPQ